jgi:LacI family transcriptional regulator
LVTAVTDDAAVGRRGAEHFLRAGHRVLVFYSPDRRAFAKVRYAGFAARCEEAGVEARLVEEAGELESALRERAGGPLAVMGCNDRAALLALEACRAAGRRVPEDAAVLGVDDDDLVQALANPPLSSVNTARDRVGFEAAALLERMMSGERVDAGTVVRVAPKGVVARRSTDATAVSDADVAEAARFIHTHAGRGISVDDVAAAATVSRRQLERRFRSAMGHSLLEEITRCRVDRARQLLLDTELTLEQIARAAGFTSASYFSVVFKRATGQTPQRYRDAYRAR